MRTEKEYKNLTVKEFTKAAEIYETDYAGIYEMCKDDYPYISSELEKEEYHDLLDCGCGTGPMISLLYEKNPAKHYTGLDITPRMIEVGKSKNLDGVDWIVGDCENLPFDENTFDAIICSNSFHHYPNPQKFFDSVKRVLRPGGRLILQDYTAPKLILWLMNHTEMPLANLTFEIADATNLPYGDASFDAVIISNALHIIPDSEKALSEINRVLKKDGILIEPNFVNHQGGLGSRIWSAILKIGGVKFGHQWSSEEYLRWLEQNGWHVTFSKEMTARIALMYTECKRK